MEMNQPPVAPRPLTVAWHPHPITPVAGREVWAPLWRPGQTVRETLVAAGVDPHQPVIVVLNDELLPVADWDRRCPAPGDIINVQATVAGGGGGGGGSSPLRIVATIAAVVYGFYTGDWKTAAQVFVYGNTAAGVIEALTAKPLKNDLRNAGGAIGQASPTYSLAGGSNRERPYEPMPVVMGTHRFFPDHGARPYTEYRGDDQYLYQIFHLGLCPLSLSEWRIGSTPIADYQDVTFHWPDAQGRITGFPGNVDTVSGAELTAAAGWITRVTSTNSYRIGIDLEAVLYHANDRGGMDEVSVTLQIQYRQEGSGTWQSGNIQAPVYTADGYWSFGEDFESITYTESPPGTWTATYSGKGAPWEQYYFDGSTDPNAAHDTSDHWEWYGTRFYFGSWRYVKYADMGGQASPPRPYTMASVTDYVLSGNNQTPLRKSLYIDVQPGTYEVRILRATPDDSDARTQSRVQWSVLRSYQEDPASYVGQNRVGIVIKATAQLNGTLQQVSVMAKALCNYWNGSAWAWGFSSNPSHRYSFFARGYRDDNGRLLFGCGLGDSQIDLAALHAWGVFCDQERLTFDAVIDGGQTAEDVLTLIARCGLGSPSRASGKLGVVWDGRNQAAVAAFGMSNIVRGSFEVSYITAQLADEIVVTFVNPAKDWQMDPVRVPVPGVTSPERPATVDLMGCANEGMAGKFANYLAAQQKYRRRRISWESDSEGFVCQRGDVVIISHDLTQWGYSGRLRAASGNALTLDRAVPRSGATEHLMLKRPDGTMTTYTVTAGSGDSDVLTLSAPPSLEAGRLPVDHIWFFSPLATPGKKVKILSVQPVSERRVKVIATDEDPQFYAAWDGTWQAAPVSTVLKRSVPAITSARVDETLVLSGGRVISRITISWATAGDYDHARFRYRMAPGGWSDYRQIYGKATSIDLRSAGNLEVEISPIGMVGIGTTFSTKSAVYGRSLPPANVGNLALAISGGVGILTFDPSPDLDVQYGGHMWLRHSSKLTGATWETAVDVAVSIPGKATSVPILPQSGTYLAKWVDCDGNASPAATILTTDYAAIGTVNAIAFLAGHPSWTGAKTATFYDPAVGGLVLNSELTIDEMTAAIDSWASVQYLAGASPSGAYALGTVDVGQIYDCMVNVPDFDVSPFDCLDFIDSRATNVDTWPSIDGAGSEDATAAIYVRMTNDDPAGASPTWSAWGPLTAGTMLRARGFQFELRLYSTRPNINILVSKCRVSVDMPDRVEHGEDIVSGAGPKAITFSAPYVGKCNVGITAQNMATGDHYTLIKNLSGSTTTGFTITFFNSAGAAISRTFDWAADGY